MDLRGRAKKIHRSVWWSNGMQDVTHMAETLGRLPIDYLIIFVSLAAIGLSAFAIHVVYRIAKRE
jgi:hypothetical protein